MMREIASCEEATNATSVLDDAFSARCLSGGQWMDLCRRVFSSGDGGGGGGGGVPAVLHDGPRATWELGAACVQPVYPSGLDGWLCSGVRVVSGVDGDVTRDALECAWRVHRSVGDVDGVEVFVRCPAYDGTCVCESVRVCALLGALDDFLRGVDVRVRGRGVLLGSQGYRLASGAVAESAGAGEAGEESAGEPAGEAGEEPAGEAVAAEEPAGEAVAAEEPAGEAVAGEAAAAAAAEAAAAAAAAKAAAEVDAFFDELDDVLNVAADDWENAGRGEMQQSADLHKCAGQLVPADFLPNASKEDRQKFLGTLEAAAAKVAAAEQQQPAVAEEPAGPVAAAEQQQPAVAEEPAGPVAAAEQQQQPAVAEEPAGPVTAAEQQRQPAVADAAEAAAEVVAIVHAAVGAVVAVEEQKKATGAETVEEEQQEAAGAEKEQQKTGTCTRRRGEQQLVLRRQQPGRQAKRQKLS
jgi:hypothetical protein